jgi:nitroreductase
VDFAEVAARRRMVRSFTGAPVDGAALQRVLDGAGRAPSAGNTGGWDAVVLQGGDQTGRFWEATTTADWRQSSRRWKGLERAPVVIAVFCHPAAYLERYSLPDKVSAGLGAGTEAWPVPYWFVDGGFAALMILLGAVAEGLGACFLGNFRGEGQLRAALGVPNDRRFVGAVLMGEADAGDPASTSSARGRRGPEVFHFGSW